MSEGQNIDAMYEAYTERLYQSWCDKHECDEIDEDEGGD